MTKTAKRLHFPVSLTTKRGHVTIVSTYIRVCVCVCVCYKELLGRLPKERELSFEGNPFASLAFHFLAV